MSAEESLLLQCKNILKGSFKTNEIFVRAYIAVDPNASLNISYGKSLVGSEYADTHLSRDLHHALIIFFFSIMKHSESAWNRSMLTVRDTGELYFETWIDEQLIPRTPNEHH